MATKKLKQRRKDPDTPAGQAAKKKRQYFPDEIRVDLESYQDSRDKGDYDGASRTFTTKLLKPFLKLIECSIAVHVHKGTMPVSQDELTNDVLKQLMTAIPRWDRTRAEKPFSYFNMVALNAIWATFAVANKQNKRAYSTCDIEGRDMDTVVNEQNVYRVEVPLPDAAIDLIESNMELVYMLNDVADDRLMSTISPAGRELSAPKHAIRVLDVVKDWILSGVPVCVEQKKNIYAALEQELGMSAKQLQAAMSLIRTIRREQKCTQDKEEDACT